MAPNETDSCGGQCGMEKVARVKVDLQKTKVVKSAIIQSVLFGRLFQRTSNAIHPASYCIN